MEEVYMFADMVEIDEQDYKQARNWVAKARNFVGEGMERCVDAGYVHNIKRGDKTIVALYADDDGNYTRFYMHKSLVEAFKQKFGYDL